MVLYAYPKSFNCFILKFFQLFNIVFIFLDSLKNVIGNGIFLWVKRKSIRVTFNF